MGDETGASWGCTYSPGKTLLIDFSPFSANAILLRGLELDSLRRSHGEIKKKPCLLVSHSAAFSGTIIYQKDLGFQDKDEGGEHNAAGPQ